MIEIIYALKQHEEELEQQNAALQKQLDDRTLRLEHAGSIAEASLALHQVFETAQVLSSSRTSPLCKVGFMLSPAAWTKARSSARCS